MVDKITSPITPLELINKTNEIIDNLGGGGSVTVDDALSTTSTNPVQNKVITNALNDKKENFTFTAPLTQTSVTVQNYGGIIYSNNQVAIPHNSNRSNVMVRSASVLDCYDINYVNSKIDWSNARYVDVPIVHNGLIGVPQNDNQRWKSKGGLFLGKYDANGDFIPKYAVACSDSGSSGGGAYTLYDLRTATITDNTYSVRYSDISSVSLGSINTNASSYSDGNFFSCFYTEISGSTLNVRCGLSKVVGSTVSSSYNAQFTSLASTSVSTDDVDTIRFFIRPYSSSTQTTNMNWWRYGTYTANDFSNSATVAQVIQNLPAIQFTQTTSKFANLNYGIGLVLDNNNLVVDATTLGNTNFGYLSGLSLPNATTYDDLTLGATGSTYQVPTDGYLVLAKGTAVNQNQHIFLGAGQLQVQIWSGGSGGYLQAFIPVLAGQYVSVTYTANGDTALFKFVYANGTAWQYTPPSSGSGGSSGGSPN